MVGVARLYIDDQRTQLIGIRSRIESLLARMSQQQIAAAAPGLDLSVAGLVEDACAELEQARAAITREPATPPAALSLAERTGSAFSAMDELLGRLPLACLFETLREGQGELTILQRLGLLTARLAELSGKADCAARLVIGAGGQDGLVPPSAHPAAPVL